MTREEAIEIFQNRLRLVKRNYSDAVLDYIQALEMAVDTLKQPEIIYCKDCKYKNDEYECPFYNMGYLCGDYSYCSYAERKDD